MKPTYWSLNSLKTILRCGGMVSGGRTVYFLPDPAPGSSAPFKWTSAAISDDAAAYTTWMLGCEYPPLPAGYARRAVLNPESKITAPALLMYVLEMVGVTLRNRGLESLDIVQALQLKNTPTEFLGVDKIVATATGDIRLSGDPGMIDALSLWMVLVQALSTTHDYDGLIYFQPVFV